MKLELTTPALLFSTTSLLMLAYTNRFLAVARLIRELHDRYLDKPDDLVLKQIRNLKRRVALIRNMQLLSIGSLLLSVLCMLLLFTVHDQLPAKVSFSISLLLMCISLLFSVWEIWISIRALNWEISDVESQSKSLLDRLLEMENPLGRNKEEQGS